MVSQKFAAVFATIIAVTVIGLVWIYGFRDEGKERVNKTEKTETPSAPAVFPKRGPVVTDIPQDR